jgi:hypothetical protein
MPDQYRYSPHVTSTVSQFLNHDYPAQFPSHKTSYQTEDPQKVVNVP